MMMRGSQAVLKKLKSDVESFEEDDIIMGCFIDSLPSIELMNAEVERIIKKIPTISEDAASAIPESAFENSEFFLDLRCFHTSSDRRFHNSSVRYLYEIMCAGYLDEIKKFKTKIDFDVYINNMLKPSFIFDYDCEDTESDSDESPRGFSMKKERAPMLLMNTISDWVDALQSKDPIFRNEYFTGEKDIIIRRGLLLSFKAHFYSAEINEKGERDVEDNGHMIFLVLEISPTSTPNHVNFHIVDNLRDTMYVQKVHRWIKEAIDHSFASLSSGVIVHHRDSIWNQMPIHDLMGACMSTSFRAMILCAFLRNPWRRLANYSEDRREANHIFRFMYYQMERMRLFFLGGTFGHGKMEPFFISKEDPTVFLHKVNTPYFWAIHIDTLKRENEGISDIHSLEAFLRGIGSDGQDFPFAKRYYFNSDLKLNFVLSGANTFLFDKPCIVQQKFPINPFLV